MPSLCRALTQAGGFAYAIAGARCVGFTVAAAAIAMAPPALLEVAAGDFSFICTAQYAYRENDWPNLSGSGSVNIAVLQTSALAVFDVFNSGPYMQVGYMSSAIQFGTFEIQFSGGSFDWLLNLFKPLIEEIVQNTIRSQLPNVLTDLLKSFNAELTKVRHGPVDHQPR